MNVGISEAEFAAGGVDDIQKFPSSTGVRFASEDKTKGALVGKSVWIDKHDEHKEVT